MNKLMLIEIIKQRKMIENILLPHEMELEATTIEWERFREPQHRMMVIKLTEFLTPVRTEYKRFQQRYPIDVYPEIWI